MLKRKTNNQNFAFARLTTAIAASLSVIAAIPATAAEIPVPVCSGDKCLKYDNTNTSVGGTISVGNYFNDTISYPKPSGSANFAVFDYLRVDGSLGFSIPNVGNAIVPNETGYTVIINYAGDTNYAHGMVRGVVSRNDIHVTGMSDNTIYIKLEKDNVLKFDPTYGSNANKYQSTHQTLGGYIVAADAAPNILNIQNNVVTIDGSEISGGSVMGTQFSNIDHNIAIERHLDNNRVEIYNGTSISIPADDAQRKTPTVISGAWIGVDIS